MRRATSYTKRKIPNRISRGVEVVSGVCCEARLATGQCNVQTASNDKYPHQAFQWDRIQSYTPASTVADLGPTAASDTVVGCPFRQAVGGAMWPTGMTRPDIANAARVVARNSYNPCERHWKAAMKILVYLNSTRDLGITYTKGEEVSLSVYTDADYASKETDSRSISGVVAVMLGNAAVYATSRTQHCVALSTTEAEYVALAERAKEGMFP